MQQLATRSGDIFDKVLSLLAIVVAVTMGFTWLLVCTQVATRYFFRYPMGWVIETAEYTLLWITFLGAAWLLKKEKHVRVDVVIGRLNLKNQALLNTITSFVGATLCLVVAWYTGEVTWKLFQSRTHILSLLEPLQAPIIMIIPVGTLLLFIQFVRRGYGYLGHWRAQ